MEYTDMLISFKPKESFRCERIEIQTKAQIADLRKIMEERDR